MAKRKKPKGWSYNAGEKGRNWVRVYEDARDGKLYAEWFEEVADPDTRVIRRKRQRLSLSKHGITTRAVAVEKAEAMAERFGELEIPVLPPVPPLTLTHLLTQYNKEVTPTKGDSQQNHDHRAKRVFLAFFDAQDETERRSDRHPSTLDRTDWERFCTWRSEGRIAGFGPVRSRAVEYDLKYMIKVLNWALGVIEGGAALLEKNPWGREIRRTQKWKMPREINPLRPGMTEEIRAGLIAHAPTWQFGAALELERETRRRNNAVRQLLWSDVNLSERTVHWRSETDKCGRENVTPLTERAVEILNTLPSRGIGPTPVFPSASDPAEPTPSDTFGTWMQRAKRRWLKNTQDPQERERLRAALRGLGYHGEKRAGVRDPDFRALPPAIQEEIAGTNYETLRRVYDRVTVEDMRRAMEARRQVI